MSPYNRPFYSTYVHHTFTMLVHNGAYGKREKSDGCAHAYSCVPRSSVKTETISPQNDHTMKLTLTFYWPLLYVCQKFVLFYYRPLFAARYVVFLLNINNVLYYAYTLCRFDAAF